MSSPFISSVLCPLVVAVSSCSALSGCILAATCVHTACRHRGPVADAARSMQWLLGCLGISDAIFAGSFLVAQLPGGWRSKDVGAACLVAASLNDVGALASALFTAALAGTLHSALVIRAAWTVRLARLTLPLAALLWLGVGVFEALLWALLYEPDGALGPDPTMPWCHWTRKRIWVSEFLYGVIIAVSLYLLFCYCRILCHYHSVHRSAAAELLRPSTADERLTPADLEERMESARHMRGRGAPARRDHTPPPAPPPPRLLRRDPESPKPCCLRVCRVARSAGARRAALVLPAGVPAEPAAQRRAPHVPGGGRRAAVARLRAVGDAAGAGPAQPGSLLAPRPREQPEPARPRAPVLLLPPPRAIEH